MILLIQKIHGLQVRTYLPSSCACHTHTHTQPRFVVSLALRPRLHSLATDQGSRSDNLETKGTAKEDELVGKRTNSSSTIWKC